MYVGVLGENSLASDMLSESRGGGDAKVIHGSGSPGCLQSYWSLSSFPQSRDTGVDFVVVSLRHARSQLVGHSGVNSKHPSTFSAEGQQALAVFCF